MKLAVGTATTRAEGEVAHFNGEDTVSWQGKGNADTLQIRWDEKMNHFVVHGGRVVKIIPQAANAFHIELAD